MADSTIRWPFLLPAWRARQTVRRRTAITRALESGLTYRQVQMMSKHRYPKTVMRYDHRRENMEQNAVNFLEYDEE